METVREAGRDSLQPGSRAVSSPAPRIISWFLTTELYRARLLATGKYFLSFPLLIHSGYYGFTSHFIIPATAPRRHKFH